MPDSNTSSTAVPGYVALAILGLSCLGCSGERRQPVYPVHGQVRLDGKPLAEAQVAFYPADQSQRVLTARTDKNGEFKLTTHEPDDGAPPGSYSVTIELREPVREGDEEVRTGRHLLPASYSKPETSGIRCEIKEGTNQLPVWELHPK